ncbi:MAG TPA: outer membrane protein assembly factor BamD [Terriglobia bacterium]|nr:outer membrane protein assembly factor BamD [Terriglobia bacterium]
MKKSMGFVIVLFAVINLFGCFGRGKKDEVVTPTATAEPDKVLYEKGLRDMQKGRYEVARLTLQTLLNTYPDSDYKEKAKLALADSFFKQGGTTGFIQAEAEYKDFITFFPTSDDSDDAQMKIAMTHYLQMEKPDRDRTQALAAEREFKNLIDQYPDSPLKDEAAQRLREVQEVLAEGDLRVARQYIMRRNYRGAFRRGETIVNSYPDFSKQDQALFALAEASEGRKDIPRAAYFYGKIVSDLPASPLSDESRKRLERLNYPIPDVNPEALARAQADQDSKEKRSMLGKVSSLFSKKPDVSMARKASRPPMTLNPQVIDMQASSQTTQPPSPPPPAQGSEASAEMGVQIVKRSSNPPANAQPASGTPSREEIEKQYERIRLAASKIKPGSRVVFAQVDAGHSTISFWIEDSAGKALSQKSSEFPVEEIGNKSEKDLETLIENLLIKNGGTA